jgi:hypothetical protein
MGLCASACAHHSGPASALPDPAAARRFEILRVSDSTFDFVVQGAKWVRAGANGIAVDPRRRDALVARFVVQRLTGDTAVALVTGQTTSVSDAHVALLALPRPRAMRRPSFWAGFVGGGMLGAAIAIVTR